MADSESEPSDDLKRQFREALERKKTKSAVAAANNDAATKQNRAKGPVENRREFRRRSGG